MKAGLLIAALSLAAGAQTIRIGIGTQDTTINCAAGGPVVRELNLLPKYLPHTGKYKNAQFDIQWKNFTTGSPLGTEMLANKLDIGQMADFPAILTANAFETAGNGVHVIYIANLSGGVTGAGNGIVVPVKSSVQSIAELKGKTISVPFGSTAHAMLLRAIQQQGWENGRDINVLTQAPEVAGSALRSGQIDAHADFAPFAELFPFRGFARKIYDGTYSGVTTTHGVIVRSDFAAKYPELVVAYLRATLEADRLLTQQPEHLSEELAKWTGIDAEVVYAFHGPGGIQTRDYTLKPEFRTAIANAQKTPHQLKRIDRDLDTNAFVDDRYIREAAKESGLNYDARLKEYSPNPFVGVDYVHHSAISNAKSVGQIWVRGEEHVRLYRSPLETLQALNQIEGAHQPVRVAFVQAHDSGIKLFAKFAWFVQDESGWAAFLTRDEAAKYAKAAGASAPLSFEDARKKAGATKS